MVSRGTPATGISHAIHDSESCRAIEAGRRVAREVEQGPAAAPNIRTLFSTVRQHDRSSTPLDPPSAAISGNGRFLLFRSNVRLLSDDVNDEADLYVLDRTTDALELLTGHPALRDSYSGFLESAITADGRFVIFRARNRRAADAGCWRIVLYDRRTGADHVLVVEPETSTREYLGAVISADAGTVAIEASDGLYVVKRASMTVERVQGRGVTPTISADGRYVAFTSKVNGRSNVYLYDTKTSETRRISQTEKGRIPDGNSSWPSISADGRYIAFVSEASDLVKGDDNGRADVFVYDTTKQTTELVSRSANSRSANAESRYPAISGDGSVVGFQSLASNLVCRKRCTGAERDVNLVWDVFVWDRRSRSMARVSADDSAEWMEMSRRPDVDYTGSVIVFSSRHPVDAADTDNDDDVYVRTRNVPVASASRR